MRILYFFGTFNPIHYGHLRMADNACCQFGFDKVLFIPAFSPPHRVIHVDMESFTHRLHMVHLACRRNLAFEVSDIESHREGPSYTVDTLRLLYPQWEAPQNDIWLLTGADLLKDVPTWHEARQLMERVHWIQADRPGAKCPSIMYLDNEPVRLQVSHLDMPVVDISATAVRQHIKAGRSIRYLTPTVVADYIRWNNLYQAVEQDLSRTCPQLGHEDAALRKEQHIDTEDATQRHN
jgi:nicotinate-nucleotide adenylyltransferase